MRMKHGHIKIFDISETMKQIVVITIVIAQFMAFGNFENYGSIESMIKSILLITYRNFPKILSLAQKCYPLCNLIIGFNIIYIY